MAGSRMHVGLLAAVLAGVVLLGDCSAIAAPAARPYVRGRPTVAAGWPWAVELVPPSGVTVKSWVIDWGDGTRSTYDAKATDAEHIYPRGVMVRTVTVSVTDADGRQYVGVQTVTLVQDNPEFTAGYKRS